MSRLTSILRKLASPRDKKLLDQSPTVKTRLRVIGRIGLRFWWAYLLIMGVLTIGTVSAGMDVYHRTEQPQFCGACHEMGHNFDTWAESRHKNITCVDCHSEEGAMGWVKSKVAGLNQLQVHFSSKDLSGMKVEQNQRRIISTNCKRCHAGVARVGERLGLGVSHRLHLEKGMDCVTCHTESFTHPRAKPQADAGSAAKPSEREILESRFVDSAECYQCHDGKSRPNGTPAFSATDEKNCLKCHPDADQALAHGAHSRSSAERKPCLDCHEQAADQPHFKLGAIGPVCLKCHEKKTFTSKHSPWKKDACDECHRVMSPAYLYKTGPRPSNALCLDCHPDLAKLLKNKTPTLKELSGFSDGDTDLHRGHAVELEEQLGGDWCLACHDPHGSDAPRALVRIRQQEDFRKPGTVTLDDEGGGTCAGGCHARKDKSWKGPAESP